MIMNQNRNTTLERSVIQLLGLGWLKPVHLPSVLQWFIRYLMLSLCGEFPQLITVSSENPISKSINTEMKQKENSRNMDTVISEQKKNTRPRGYTAFFILNSTEHEILTAHNNKNARNLHFPSFQTLRCCIYDAHKC